MKLYVGNISYETTEDELRQSFSAYGEVASVSLISDRATGRPRGFGFVEMNDREEAQNAIKALNGSQLGGRSITVSEARPTTERAPRDSGGFRGGGGSRGGGGGRGGGRW